MTTAEGPISLHEAQQAVRTIVERVPTDSLPQGRMQGDVLWFGGHGWPIRGKITDGIPSELTTDAIDQLFQAERATRAIRFEARADRVEADS